MARSNFNSSVPDTAWFTMFDPGIGSGVVVSTTGYGFVKSFQAVAKDTLNGTGPLATYDGHTIDAGHIGVDGNWGTNTFKALWALINRMNATSIAATIRSDALAGRISRTSLNAAAIVVGEALGGNGALVPSDAITPPYGREAPGRASGSIINVTTYAGVPSTNTTRPTASGDASARDLVASAITNTSRTPARTPSTPSTPAIGPGSPAPGTTTGGTPEGRLPATTTLGSRVSWGVVAVAAVGVGVAVALAVNLSKKPGAERASSHAPTRRMRAHGRG